MRKLLLVTIAVWLTATAAPAAAHVQQASGKTEHKLVARIAHDQGVIRSVDKQAVHAGSWLFLTNELWRERDWHAQDLAKAQAALQRIRDRWLVRGFICIHGHEGAWNDPNAPYYGGLQMDLGFQRAYGPELLASKGTADRWTPAEQIAVAIRAYKSGRGWHPWPNTARYCGLL